MPDIINDVYIQVTPAGAFYCLSEKDKNNASRKILSNIMLHGDQQKASMDMVKIITEIDNEDTAADELIRLQKIGFIGGFSFPHPKVSGNMETVMPSLLKTLSDKGRSLLSDNNGFYLCASSIPHESAENLAAMSADLMRVQATHERLLANNLHIPASGWGMIGPSGLSTLGIWPLYVNDNEFLLTVIGVPKLQGLGLVQMATWMIEKFS
jgi:hypothetical protein